MISAVHKALYDFWSALGIPVYLHGKVPQKNGEIVTSYPYMTISVAGGSDFSQDVLTVLCWHKNDKNAFLWSCNSANAERNKLLDKIAAAVPAEGVLLNLSGGGKLFLYRSDSSFQSFYDDPQDGSVIGSRTAIIAKYLTI